MSIRKRKSKVRGRTVQRYGVRVYDPRIGDNKWVGTFATLKEAQKAERAALDEIDEGLSSDSMTVREWADRWMEEFPRPRESTNLHNRQQLRPFLKEFGARQMRTIRREEARAFAKRYPANTRVVKAMFNDALSELDDPPISGNVFARLRLEKTRPRPLALTEAELHDLAGCAHVLGAYGPFMRGMILFSGYTGLRFGEMAALRHHCIQGEFCEVLLSVSKQGAETLPKGNKTRRVSLFPPARRALLEMPRTLGEYVFTSPSGRRLSQADHYYHWKPVRAAFLAQRRTPERQEEIQKHLVWHTLRHTAATILIERGNDRWDVARQLGHSGPSLVESTYGHPEEGAAHARLQASFVAPDMPAKEAKR